MFSVCSRETIDDAALCARFSWVGGALRYVLSADAFNARVGAMKSDKRSLHFDKVMEIHSYSLASQQVDQNRLLATKFLPHEVQESGDETVDYKKSNIVFARLHALLSMIYYAYETAYDDIVQNHVSHNGSYFGARFEELSCLQLQKGGEFVMKQSDRKRKVRLTLMESDLVCVPSHNHMTVIIDDVIAQIKEHTSCTLYRPPPNFGVLDFFHSKGSMYNATLNMTHNIAIRPLRELVRVCGGRMLDLYWCVPNTQKFQNFVQRPISDKSFLRK